MSDQQTISIVIPAKNEEVGLANLLPVLKDLYPNLEIIVVDDGSTDKTSDIIKNNGVKLVRHPYSKGNGASIKSGARAASGDILVFMDADGQHDPADIERLINELAYGYDMVVGARGNNSQASFGRSVANRLYNRLAGYITGRSVKDLTSGFRVVRAKLFKEFLYLLPNGFSYPTTSTMAFFRAGYSISYIPIVAASREGKSHIQPIKDGVRFLLIIFKIGTLYSPLKIFAPAALGFFTMGVGWYVYTYITMSRFTNMSALLMTVGFIVFMMGLISEQITALMYKDSEKI